MRAFILESCAALVWVMAAINLAFTVLLLRRYTGERSPILLCMGLIALGLFYDALVISLGGVLEGPLLAALSRMRFVSHGGLIPLLFPICAYGLRAGKPVLTGVWIFTALVMAAGVAEGFATVLELSRVGGITRYVSAETTPAWAETVGSLLSYGTVVPLIVCGVAVWIRDRTPTLFLSGFLMFAFSALGPATGNFDLIFFISMAGRSRLAPCSRPHGVRTSRKAARTA